MYVLTLSALLVIGQFSSPYQRQPSSYSDLLADGSIQEGLPGCDVHITAWGCTPREALNYEGKPTGRFVSWLPGIVSEINRVKPKTWRPAAMGPGPPRYVRILVTKPDGTQQKWLGKGGCRAYFYSGCEPTW